MTDAQDHRDFDQQVRLYVYQHIVANTQPPSTGQTAAALGVAEQTVQAAYERLHDRHALLIDTVTHSVLMANPLSGVPTVHRVTVNGRELYANCAWDTLGVAAMLHTDVEINAQYGDTQEALRLTVQGDRVSGDPALVHIMLPFRQWYDDIRFT